MATLKPSQDVQPLSAFRANAAGFLDQIHETKRPLVITQHGRSSAVVLDVGEYEAMVEELDVIRDIRIGLQQIDAGQGIPHDEVMAQLRSMIPE